MIDHDSIIDIELGNHPTATITKKDLSPNRTFINITNKDTYKLHVKEMIRKSIKGEDTDTPTDAEVITLLLKLSSVVPLSYASTMLYAKLTNEHFGDTTEGDTYNEPDIDRLYHRLKQCLSSELPIEHYKDEFAGDAHKPMEKMTKMDVLGELFK